MKKENEILLVSCKKCHARAELINDYETKSFYVCCKGCKAVSPTMKTSRSAKLIWNEMNDDGIKPLATPNNRITPEMISKGIELGFVQFIKDPNADHGTVCLIGNYWFYFGGLTGEENDPEDFINCTLMSDNINSIIDTLDDFRKQDETKDEYAYYLAYLNEHLYGCAKVPRDWKDVSANPPPAGVPLIMKIHCGWKDFEETIGPVYYMKDSNTGKFMYYNVSTTLETIKLIGPDQVKFIYWDFWPKR